MRIHDSKNPQSRRRFAIKEYRAYRSASTREPPGPRVYFVQARDGGAIKIGHTIDLEQRFRALQTGSPVDLVLLGSVEGDGKLEKELHYDLRADRVRGEWFRPSEAVLARMAQLGVAEGRRVVLREGEGRQTVPCKVCGYKYARLVLGQCEACREFAELRTAGDDPFNDAEIIAA